MGKTSQTQSQSTGLPNSEEPFDGAHHEWTVLRAARTFVVRVIEPDRYAPEDHSRIFTSVMSHLVSPAHETVLSSKDLTPSVNPDPFDLVTFPEAFVPADTLIDTLVAFAYPGAPTGCVHVGLRPNAVSDRHLFTTAEVTSLIADVVPLGRKITSDVASFEAWLMRQPDGHHFNIGCLFAVDADGELRVCLHPKIVRSQFEISPLPEKHMDEGGLLSVVTLLPSDKAYLSVTIQPIICSDALNLPRDRPGGPPLQAVNTFASRLSDHPPDHVDVVSVATCTPQREVRTDGQPPYRVWHEKFREAFRATAESASLSRHHFAAVVLSNFRNLSTGDPGGLSGVFLPVPPRHAPFHPSVHVSCFGRLAKGGVDNGWSQPGDNALDRWSNRGFVACLDPFAAPADTPVRIFGFTIQRLPRDNNRWDPPESLTKCAVLAAEISSAEHLQFKKDGAHE